MRTVPAAAVISSLAAALSLGAAPQSGPSRGIVRGRVVSADSGTPLRKVRVALTPDGGKPAEPVYTNADGDFEITGVAPGRYTVSAVKTGFVIVRFGAQRRRDPATQIAVGSGTTGDINFTLVRGGTLTGRVVDNVGDPIYRANVVVGFIKTVDGRPGFQAVNQMRTDDRGEYLIGGLEDGDYALAVTFSPELPNLKTIYYPDSTALTEARTLSVRPGEVTRVNDVSVGSTARDQQGPSGGDVSRTTPAPSTASISGRVVTTDGRLLRQTIVRAHGSSTSMQRGALTDSEGRFQLPNLVADSYTITISRNGYLTVDSTERRQVAGTRVTLRDGEALERVEVIAARSPIIAGQVTDEDGEPIEGTEVKALQSAYVNGRRQLIAVNLPTSTDSLGQFRLPVLRPGEYAISVTPRSEGALWLPGYPTTFFPGATSVAEAQLVEVDIGRDAENVVVRLSPKYRVRMKADGTFEMPGVFGPMRFVLDAPAAWMIKSIRSGDTDLTDKPLMTAKPNQSIDDLEIVVTNRSASLSGAVVDARGRAVAEYTVIVFATDPDRWYSQSRFLKFATPEPDGSFKLRGLPTAEYFVAAVEPMLATPAAGEWQAPAFLTQLARRAVRVTLTEGQSSTLTVTGTRDSGFGIRD